MSTEGPDLPMMIDDPAKFRDEQVRRKSAERERDDLAKQAERLIEENEELTANVATLVEQLAAQESITSAHIETANENGRKFVALKSERDALVEQLGEAERLYRTTREGANQYTAQALHLQRLIIRIVKYAHEDGAVTPRSTRLARALAEAEQTLAGASRPVVEPRDETKPPPGWRGPFMNGACEPWYERAPCPTSLHGAWLIFHREHRGYAPHPSGTGGPPDGDAVDLAEVWAVCNERYGDIGMDAYSPAEAMRMVLDRAEEVGEERALAASPPDGTAPERDSDVLQTGVGHWSEDKNGGFICEDGSLLSIRSDVGAVIFGDAQGERDTRLVPLGIMRKLLATRPPDGTLPERAPDDRAVIVSIRDGLAKHFEEEAEEYADDEGIREGLLKAAELLRTTGMVAAEYGTATRPPDGTAPERADRVCSGMTAFWCPVHGDCTCPRDSDGECEFDHYDCPLHGVTSEHSEGRPPDGMPGEPAEGRKFPVHSAWTIRHGGPREVPWSLLAPHEATAQRNHGGQTLEKLAERGGLSPCEMLAIVEGRRWRRMPDEEATAGLAALLTATAPPTVPGEPPRRADLHAIADRMEEITRPEHGGDINLDDHGKSILNLASALRDIADAAPPTPPLTPERAPLDEAALKHIDEAIANLTLARIESPEKDCDEYIARALRHLNAARRSEGAG